jgi:hypothetical protein
MHRRLVVIDRVRKDALVFASDYSECDHSTDGFRKVMFRVAPEVAKGLVTGAAYSLEYATEDVQKPYTWKSNSGKTTYSCPQMFYHKVANLVLVSRHPDADLLLDL